MEDFKLKYYFVLYKDSSIPRSELKEKFIKKHGKLERLNELMRQITNYQVKKYGCELNNFVPTRTKEEKMKLTKIESGRNYKRRKR